MMEADKKTVILPMDQLIGLVQLQLSEKGSASLVVTGNSMLPIFRHMRDRVLLAPPENFKKGDIILYRRDDGKYVLHRILKKKDGYVICSGDNQWVVERVEDTWVLAVVTGFYKHSKQYSVTNKWYRLYKWVWVAFFPVRRPILWLGKKLFRLKNKLWGD